MGKHARRLRCQHCNRDIEPAHMKGRYMDSDGFVVCMKRRGDSGYVYHTPLPEIR